MVNIELPKGDILCAKCNKVITGRKWGFENGIYKIILCEACSDGLHYLLDGAFINVMQVYLDDLTKHTKEENRGSGD